MTSAVYKYSVQPQSTVQLVEMPSGGKIISAIEKHGSIYLYALIPDVSVSTLWNVQRRVLVLGTGWEFDAAREYEMKPYEELRFINTVQVGTFVWHVFEIVECELLGGQGG